MSIPLQISPRLIPSIASLYTDANRVFLEYIDNSIDSAQVYYDEREHSYTRPIEITLALLGRSYRDGKVIIYDNCFGITNFPKVVQSIGNSDKKTNAFTNGQFGYGIYSFMAICSALEISSKLEEDLCTRYIPIHREKFDADNQADVSFPSPKPMATLCERKEREQLGLVSSSDKVSGTKIVLSKFEKKSWGDIDLDQLKDEIEKHFEFLLRRDNLHIRLVANGVAHECKPFDYEQYEGDIYEDRLSELTVTRYGSKSNFVPKPPIHVFIKVTKGQEINKRPIFICKGRRIGEIKDIKSFKSRNKSHLWDHPNVTGYVDVGDFVEPTIARTEFRNTSQSKALFEKLIELEPLILDVVRDVNKASEQRHYRELEDRLNRALSALAKIDSMNFRTDYLAGGDVNLAAGSTGRKAADGFGNDEHESGTGSSSQPTGTDEGEGVGAGDDPGSIPGPPDGGASGTNIEPENPFEDSGIKGRERRKSGFNVRIVDTEPVIDATNDEPLRSVLVGNEIRIFKGHSDFEKRVETSRRGGKRLTQRLITYLAGEITVHYKDQFHQKMGQPVYDKRMFVDLVGFVYRFESMLADLAGKNLSDLS